MFEFPDAQGGEEERFGSGQGAGGGHDVLAIVMAVGTAAGASGFLFGFGFADGPGAWAGDESMAAIHNYCISCNYQHI